MAKTTPEAVYNYLIGQGVGPNKAAGMVANVQAESSFNPSAIGDAGQSFGLFQHYNERGDALKKFAANSGREWNDWQAQIDYALTEPDTKRYLKQDFASPAEASKWFTTQWERPANAQQKAIERLKYLPNVANFTGGGIPMTGAASGSPTTPASVPDALGAMAPAAAAGGGADTGAWLDQQIQQLMSGQGQGQQGQAMAAQEPQGWQDKIAAKLNSPLVQVGLGILGANGNYGDWAGAIGQGASQGLKNYNQAQAQQASQRPKQSSALDQLSRATKMMDLRDRMSERKAAQSYRASLDPEERAMSEAAAAGDPTAQMALKERFTPEAGPEVSSSAVKYSELLNMRGPDGAPLYTPEEAAGIAYKAGGTTVNVGQQGADGGIQYGNVQPGYMRTVDQETGVPTDTPISGTKHDLDRKKAIRNAHATFAANDRMRELVREHGEGLDLIGNPEATARMRMVIQEQLKNMAGVSETGVINEGEAKRMLMALADPTAKFTFADVESIVGAIDEFDQRLERALGIKKIPGWTPENPEGTGGAGGSSGLNEGLGEGWSIELDEDIAAAGGA